VSKLAMCHLDIAADGASSAKGKLTLRQWHTLRFAWKSTEPGAVCELALDGKPAGALPIQRRALHGLSYIHFQSTAEQADHGLLVESVRAEVTPPGALGTR